MNTIKTFFDLKAWQEGHSLVLEIYRITSDFPRQEQFGIISQTRRAASSITANIAEGFARFHFKDKARFYHQSRGSIAEVQNFLVLAKDLGYIEEDPCSALVTKADEIGRLVNGMIRSIENQRQVAA